MGMYDWVFIEQGVGKYKDQHPQVKCWKNKLKCYKIGDSVPQIKEKRVTYSIRLLEGGFVNVEYNKIVSYTPNKAEFKPIYNKWGGRFLETDYKVSHGMYKGFIGRN